MMYLSVPLLTLFTFYSTEMPIERIIKNIKNNKEEYVNERNRDSKEGRQNGKDCIT